AAVLPSAMVRGMEAHFEAVKFKLLGEHIRCTHCHASRDDTTLTLYGQKIAELGKDLSVPERVRRHEREIPANANAAERAAAQARLDVDGDGVPNWIEILSGRDPSVKEPGPEGAAAEGAAPPVERVTSLMKCTLCHIRVDAVAGPGKSRAPHNAFGKSLTEFDAKGHRLHGAAAKQADAEDVEILKRLDLIANEDADADQFPNWTEIRTFHHPADAADKPTPAEIKALRQNEAQRRKQDEGFGKVHRER
ncbi:MAG TPA: hypothetical protein VGM03_14790, partial [Phycisphaerae bacterium]